MGFAAVADEVRIARFPNLLNLPEGADTRKAINDAMRVIEADNEGLKDVLPRTHNRLDKELLVSLLKNFAAVPMDIEGDAFGKISSADGPLEVGGLS
jgi:type I restriction enzyme M protein